MGQIDPQPYVERGPQKQVLLQLAWGSFVISVFNIVMTSSGATLFHLLQA